MVWWYGGGDGVSVQGGIQAVHTLKYLYELRGRSPYTRMFVARTSHYK